LERLLASVSRHLSGRAVSGHLGKREYLVQPAEPEDRPSHLVNQQSGSLEPDKFEHYETALIDLINQKRAGKPIVPKERPATSNVVDLMEGLRRSVGKEAAPSKAAEPKKPRKASSGQKEMLMPIEGKKPKEAAAKKPAAKPQEVGMERLHCGHSAMRRQPRGRVRVKWKPFGVNLRATARTSPSHVSSAIFWASMTSPIGRGPIGMKHSPSCRRPRSSISHTFTEVPAWILYRLPLSLPTTSK
jgi:DNA end-binding protein Ku